jgi:hypothetical protein
MQTAHNNAVVLRAKTSMRVDLFGIVKIIYFAGILAEESSLHL